jgi:hypothetical protein
LRQSDDALKEEDDIDTRASPISPVNQQADQQQEQKPTATSTPQQTQKLIDRNKTVQFDTSMTETEVSEIATDPIDDSIENQGDNVSIIPCEDRLKSQAGENNTKFSYSFKFLLISVLLLIIIFLLILNFHKKMTTCNSSAPKNSLLSYDPIFAYFFKDFHF